MFSIADELLKLKQLLDCGAISDDEFQMIKAQILTVGAQSQNQSLDIQSQKVKVDGNKEDCNTQDEVLMHEENNNSDKTLTPLHSNINCTEVVKSFEQVVFTKEQFFELSRKDFDIYIDGKEDTHCYNLRNSRALAIFGKDKNVKTRRGIDFNSSKADVIREYGECEEDYFSEVEYLIDEDYNDDFERNTIRNLISEEYFTKEQRQMCILEYWTIIFDCYGGISFVFDDNGKMVLIEYEVVFDYNDDDDNDDDNDD